MAEHPRGGEPSFDPRILVLHGGIVLLCLLFLLASVEALADSRSARKRKRKQRDLNNAAIEAMVDGEHEKAIGLLEESLELGELNVTWLNLGRAYAKVGRCADALEAYDRMAVAPRVDEPPPEVLYDVLAKYRKELFTECPATVIIRCSQRDLTVTIDGGDPVACEGNAVEVTAGTHTFAAQRDGEVVESREVEVRGLTTSYVDFNVPVPPPSPPATATGGLDWRAASGIAGLATGGSMLVAAAVVDGAIIVPHIDRFEAARDRGDVAAANELRLAIETEQAVSTGLYIAGGTVLAAGGGLLVYWLVDSDEAETSETESVTWSAGPAGVTPSKAKIDPGSGSSP